VVFSAKAETARNVTSWADAVDAMKTAAKPMINVGRMILPSGRKAVGNTCF